MKDLVKCAAELAAQSNQEDTNRELKIFKKL